MNKYIFALALLQVVATAQNDFEIDEDDFLYRRLSSDDRYQLPRGSPKYPKRYFSATSQHYQYDSNADEKLAQLWEMLVPDETVVEEPTPFFWSKFDDFFQNKASGPFCNPGDELRKHRTKTSHT